MYYTIGSANELYHFGVKGMKWGVRKSEEQRAAEYKKKKAGKIEKKMNRLLARNQRKFGDSQEGQAKAKHISAIYNQKMKATMNMSVNDVKLEKMIKRNNVRRVVSGVLVAASTAAAVAGIFSPVGRAVSAGISGAGRFMDANTRFRGDSWAGGHGYLRVDEPTPFGAIVGSIGKELSALSSENYRYSFSKW